MLSAETRLTGNLDQFNLSRLSRSNGPDCGCLKFIKVFENFLCQKGDGLLTLKNGGEAQWDPRSINLSRPSGINGPDLGSVPARRLFRWEPVTWLGRP